MWRIDRLGKDHLGGAILLAVGIAVTVTAIGYDVGTPSQMGAGFVPVALGVLLLVIGVAMILTGKPAAEDPMGPHGPFRPEWRGWLCIVGSVFAFAVLARYGGMVPAGFVTIFVAAMGDREATLFNSALFAVGLDLLGVAVFHFGLNLQLSLFSWG